MTVLFRANPVMLNNVNSTNVVTNSNDEELTIPHGLLYDRSNHCHPQHYDRYYVLDTYEGFELWMYLYPVLTHHQFHQCSWYSRNPRLGRRAVILPASFYGWNVIDITRNRQVIQVCSSLVRSSDLKIANQDNNLLTTMIIDDPEVNYTSVPWKTSAFRW